MSSNTNPAVPDRNVSTRKSHCSGRPSFYGRTPDERDRDVERVELALRGRLFPLRKLNSKHAKIVHTKVAGVTFPNEDGTLRQDLLRAVRLFDQVKLERTPDSKHDRFAVAVIAEIDDEAYQIGNLPAECSADIGPSLDAGDTWQAVITRVGGFPSIGVTLMLLRTSRGGKKS